jgi:hypothetical protein
LAFVVCALALWFGTQALLGSRKPSEGIGDSIHQWTASLNAYLLGHPRAANLLLILSSAAIDALALFLLAASIFGPTLRPFIGLLILFILRQVCQGLCALPLPQGLIWHAPGFPSLLVTYGVANDLFFSGHTGLAVLGAVELSRLRRPWLTTLAIAVAVIESFTVLILRAHYTMDVFTGALAALYAATLAARIAPAVDRWLNRSARAVEL